jgi:tetratricopeptide (TPR) repeat protein
MRILIGAQAAHTNHFGLANQTARRYRDNQPNEQNERAAYYRVALALRPTNAVCWNNLAAALQGKGDLDGALAAFQESIRLDGKNPRPHAGLGSVYYDKKDLERAKAEFEEAIRLGHTFGMAHRYLGDIHRDQKDFAGALVAYREASRVEPGFFGDAQRGLRPPPGGDEKWHLTFQNDWNSSHSGSRCHESSMLFSGQECQFDLLVPGSIMPVTSTNMPGPMNISPCLRFPRDLSASCA